MLWASDWRVTAIPLILWITSVALGSWGDAVLKVTDNPELARCAGKFPFIAILVLNVVCTRMCFPKHVVRAVLIGSSVHSSFD